jgi:hypothetical protein
LPLYRKQGKSLAPVGFDGSPIGGPVGTSSKWDLELQQVCRYQIVLVLVLLSLLCLHFLESSIEAALDVIVYPLFSIAAPV